MSRIHIPISVILCLLLASCSKDPIAPMTAPELKLLDYNELKRTSVILNASPETDVYDGMEFGFIVGSDYEMENNARRYQASVLVGNTFSLQLTDLEIGHTYYYKAYITSGGKTKTSEVSDFTTPFNSAPLLSDVEISAGVISAHIIDNGGFRISHTGFCWSSNENPDVFSNTCEVNPDEDGEFRMKLTDIESSDKLYFRAYADNGSGENLVTYSNNQIKYLREDFIQIPDNTFSAYLLSNYDLNADGGISISEAESIMAIEVPYMEISSLSGLEYCRNLESLNCNGNRLAELNLSNCSKLKSLDCGNNKLTVLDISQCGILTDLNCSYNRIQILDITKCPFIESIDCAYNVIEELDLSNCRLIKNLICACNNSINSLKGLEFCERLVHLDCGVNSLPELNIQHCPDLEYLLCNNNLLTGLDLSNCSKLTNLQCYENAISHLNVDNCQQLDTLICYYNQLEELNLSNKKQLKHLDCRFNKITSLQLGNCNNLVRVDLNENLIEEISISDCKNLEYLYCRYNSIKSMTITNCNISYMECGRNYLQELDLSTCDIAYLECELNDIVSLNVNNCHSLEILSCDRNRIEILSLLGCEKLRRLDASENSLNSLYTGECPNLETLYCYMNKYLTSLDLTLNPKLNYLDCRNCFSLQYIYLPIGIALTTFNHDDDVNIIYR